MSLFRRLNPKYQPLLCRPNDLLDLFQQGLDMDAPVVNLVVEYAGMPHKLGMTSDYNRRRGFFDTVYYFDSQTFPTMEELTAQVPIFRMSTVLVLKDEDVGDPRGNVLLAGREIKPR